MEQIQVRISRDGGFRFDQVALYVRKIEKDLDGLKFIHWPKAVEYEQIIPEGVLEVRDPLLYLPDYAAQELMDELWQAGFKPTEIQSESNPQTISTLNAHINNLLNYIRWLQSLVDKLIPLHRGE